MGFCLLVVWFCGLLLFRFVYWCLVGLLILLLILVLSQRPSRTKLTQSRHEPSLSLLALWSCLACPWRGLSLTSRIRTGSLFSWAAIFSQPGKFFQTKTLQKSALYCSYDTNKHVFELPATFYTHIMQKKIFTKL